MQARMLIAKRTSIAVLTVIATVLAIAWIENCTLPTPTDQIPHDFPGIHNVVCFSDGLLSGSAPEGTTGFASLAKLGVRSIISVDGPVPDLLGAKQFGLRYVHLPIGYDGIMPLRRVQLMSAVRQLAAPIYIHCHHGKHRSAAAAGFVCVGLGRLNNESAAKRMEISGTSRQYAGLWKCVEGAAPISDSGALLSVDELPVSVAPSSLVAAMSSLDNRLDELRTAMRTGWSTPMDADPSGHLESASAMVDELRSLRTHYEASQAETSSDGDVRTFLDTAVNCALALEDALAVSMARANKSGAPKPWEPNPSEVIQQLDELTRAVSQSCTACHARYRDIER